MNCSDRGCLLCKLLFLFLSKLFGYLVSLLYIQLGQALSTRPDILPTIYCQELSKLQVYILFFSVDLLWCDL